MFDPDFYDPKNAAVVDRTGGFIISGNRYDGIVRAGNEVPSAEGGRIPELHSGEFDSADSAKPICHFQPFNSCLRSLIHQKPQKGEEI